MSKSNVFENDFLNLLLNGIAIADLAENDTTSPLTNFTFALHTADPGEAGDQATNEATYTSYARVNVARGGSPGWTVAAGVASPPSDVTFPTCTGGSNTITHVSIGTGVSDKMLWSGALSPNLAVSSGVTPVVKSTSTITEN